MRSCYWAVPCPAKSSLSLYSVQPHINLLVVKIAFLAFHTAVQSGLLVSSQEGFLGLSCIRKLPPSLGRPTPLGSSISHRKACLFAGRKVAVKYGQLDSNISLSFAFFVNAAMLIIAAAVFHFGKVKNEGVADITTAYKLLEPALGDKVAPKLFAVALLCSGQQSTITGTSHHSVLLKQAPSFPAPLQAAGGGGGIRMSRGLTP